MGKIDRIEVENFKSYKDKQIIGPFEDFTAVIGPNGAGKSNLMDAISFVLGIRAANLRGSQLKDLIYKVEKEPKKNRKAAVSLYYTDEEKDIVFSRTIQPNGDSEYILDGKTVQWKHYDKKLQSLGLLVKARNFLVFQGDVESIAAKTNKELSELIEVISGSNELEEEYNACQETNQKAEEDVIFAFRKKKGINAEKKQYKEQKEEADNYNKLLDSQKQQKARHMEWQLYTFHKNMKAHNKQIKKLEKDLQELSKEQKKSEKKVEDKKKEYAGVQKEKILADKNSSKAKLDHDNHKPELFKNQEAINHSETKMEQIKKDLKKAKKEDSDKLSTIKDLENQLKTVKKDSDALEKNIQEKEGDKIELVEDQLNTYNELKQAVGKQTSSTQQQLEKLDRAQKTANEDLNSFKNKIQELQDNENREKEEKKKNEARLSVNKELVQEQTAKKNQVQKELEALKTTNEISKKREQEVSDLLGEVQVKLGDAKADAQESRREMMAKEALASLKRTYEHSVFGRMVDLVDPQHKKYEVAVTVALGRYMDAVVVDTEKTALECVQFLKSSQMCHLTFLPLDTLQIKPIDEKLRSGGRQLIIDHIKYDQKYQKAVVFACGNTLYCDTIQDARRVCFGKTRQRAVTQDGTLIRKSGIMTGGLSGVEEKAKAWGNKDVEKLKVEKNKYLEELQQLKQSFTSRQKEENLNTELISLTNKLDYSTRALDYTQGVINNIDTAIKNNADQMRKITPVRDDLKGEVDEREKEMEELRKDINLVEDEVFQDFSASVGVKNIREYQEGRLQVAQEFSKQKLELSNLVGTLEQKLEYENQRDTQSKIQDYKEKIADEKKSLAKLTKSQDKLDKENAKLKKTLEEMNTITAEKKLTLDKKDLEMKRLKKQVNEKSKETASVEKKAIVEENQIERLKTKRHEVFAEVDREDIPIHLLDPKQKQLALVDDNSRAENVDFQYVSKNEKYIVNSQAEFNQINDGFKEKLAQIAAKINKIAPNLKAGDHFEEVNERAKGADTDFEDERTKAREAKEAFDKIKTKRSKIFNKCFDHVSSVIDDIYKELTKSRTQDNVGIGGSADLSVDNQSEPYLGGIKFNATPPKKRFREMEQLSGGEKTVAALALLFAINSYKPAPFFVLDEIDAPLDPYNVAKVARYIQAKSQENVQFIVISLKDSFFGKADSLIGIYRDVDKNSSGTLTLNLKDRGI